MSYALRETSDFEGITLLKIIHMKEFTGYGRGVMVGVFWGCFFCLYEKKISSILVINYLIFLCLYTYSDIC